MQFRENRYRIGKNAPKLRPPFRVEQLEDRLTPAALDVARPLVQSIERVAASNLVNQSGDLGFVVTFNEAVTGVDAADFVAVKTGDVTFGAPLSVVPVSDRVYNVTVPAVTAGNGTLGLNLVDNGSIRDLADNAFFPGDRSVEFAAPATWTVGTGSNAVDAGDINGDGHVDLVVNNNDSVNISLLLGNGNGTFKPQQTLGLSFRAGAMGLADVNSDGKLDMLAIVNSSQVNVFLGNGNATFKPPTTFATLLSFFEVADINHDGKPDLAVVSAGGQTGYHLGNGDGKFGGRVTINSGTNPQRIALADLNDDGNLDILTSNSSPSSVSISLGNGNGSFKPRTTLPSLSGVTVLVPGDFDGDGTIDIATKGNFEISVLLGNGDGALRPANQTFTSVQQIGGGMSAADIDGDGRLDLVTGNTSIGGNAGPVVLIGNGDGSFLSKQTFNGAGTGPSAGVPLADFDHDQKLDVAMVSPFTSLVAVVRGIAETSTVNVGPKYDVDSTAPTSPITIRPPSFSAASVTLQASGIDPVVNGITSGVHHLEYQLDGAPLVSGPPLTTVSFSGLSDGTHVFRARAVDNAGNVGAFSSWTWTVDVASPRLVSIAGGYSNSNTIPFTVTFSEPVVGVDAADFAAFPSGGGTPSIQVNGSGSVYTVSVGGFAGASVRLDFVDDGSIVDAQGKRLAVETAKFKPAQTIAGRNSQYSIHVADLNGDGQPDIVSVAYFQNSVSILLGNGNGTFLPQQTFSVTSPRDLAVADVNLDGILDLVVASSNSNCLTYLGNGNGTFKVPNTNSFSAIPYSVTVGDVNGDGKPDVVVAAAGSKLLVFKGNGDGTYVSATFSSSAAMPTESALADFDADGDLDVVVAGKSTNLLSVLLNDGAGAFPSAVTFATQTSPADVAVGDLDGDGRLDLAATNSGSGTFSILFGNGNGTFQLQVPHSVGTTPRPILVVDVDGDDTLDVVVGKADGGVGVLIGNGNGTFEAQATFAAFTSLIELAIGDLNNDQKPDLVAASYNNITPRLLLANGVASRTGPTATIDQTIPNVAILTHPPATSGSASADFTFDATDASGIAGLAYSLDNGAFVGASGSATVSGLAHGSHTFRVRATDNAGNVAFASYTWFVDLVGPLVTSIERNLPAAQTTAATSVQFLVTFSEAVLNVDAADFRVVKTATVTTGSIQVSGSGATRFVTINGVGGSGQLGLNLVDNGTITDLAGNRLANSLQPAAFEETQTFAAGTAASAATMADLDGDGALDLIETNGTNVVTVIRGQGDGSLGAAATYAVGRTPVAVVVADVDGDDAPDLVVVNRTGAGISLLLGNGDGTFQPQQTIGTGPRPAAAAFADLNGDGNPDVVVVNLMNNSAAVLLGNGNGTFQNLRTFATGALPDAIAIGDVNGDGKLDLVVANQGSQSVSILVGNGDGNFPSRTDVAVGALPSALALTDVNGDGSLDVVVANKGTDSVSVLIGAGNGSFAPQTTFAVGSLPRSIAVGDVSGDAIADVVVATTSGVSVLRGNGDGTFAPQQTFAAAGAIAATLADLDGDGKLDVVIASEGGTAGVLIGASTGNATGQTYVIDPDSAPPPTPGFAPAVTGLSPAHVSGVTPFIGPTSGGTAVVITGVNFVGVTSVQFGGVDAASYVVNSPTQITAVSPPNRSGLVDVTVTNGLGTSSASSSADDYTYAQPEIVSVVVNGGPIAVRDRHGKTPDLAEQTSVVTQILVTFNQAVTLDAGAFSLASIGVAVSASGAAPKQGTVAVNAAGVGAGGPATGYSQYLLTFAPGPGVNVFDGYTTLEDGAWQLLTTGAKIHAGGDVAADRADAFWSLFGAAHSQTDALATGTDPVVVDGIDLSAVYAAFGSRSDDPSSPYRATFDWNLDGFVDGVDLSRLYANFGAIWQV